MAVCRLIRLRLECSIIALILSPTLLIAQAGTQPLANFSYPPEIAASTQLQRAAKMNGIAIAEGQPLHLKLSFQLFDPNSDASEHGTIESLWANEHKFKTTFTTPSSKQVIVGTKFMKLRSGDAKEIPGMVTFLIQNFLSPIAVQELNSQTRVQVEHRERAGVALTCFTARSIDVTGPDMKPMPSASVCVDTHSFALSTVIFGETGVEGVFENPVLFRGRYLPGDLKITKNGKIMASAHLELIEAFETLNEADFVPPPDAVEIPNLSAVKIPGDITKGMLIKKIEPEYPRKAKKAKIEGTVIVHIVIGVDGLPADIEAVSGPTELQESVVKAVKKWVYKPYLLNGAPVQVDSTITTVFKLGR